MFGLFDPSYRRVRDEREVRYYFSKYGEDAPDILSARAHDDSLDARNRRHWRRVARMARQRQSDFLPKH
ncbi:hypothetical protein [Parasphingorhabdus sp.]|uniref:hypothetical protein n=1 Tax=Parasphingorhabdus sp. TaxID=2709688 RepID=UPI003001317D